MRKQQKQELLECIKTLHSVHEEICQEIARKNMIQTQNLLSDCQEFAIQLGSVIEELEGEGHITVSFLEEYCEILFFLFNSLKENKISDNKASKLLKKRLLKIENSIKNDIRVRKEVVFFPYKASMWDSLESVYLSAKADPDCDAYCVPIPYYDLNPDHSLGKMYYEGGEYPKDIEIIDWQTYNFEERKPDQIYIHNAYDEWNLVTTIHPRFYSENLKKYTEMLVYIPYFILGEIDPEDKKEVDRMKHFCFMPGIIYADKVVLQSESIRKIYINEYMKAAKECGMQGERFSRAYLEQKFLGIGSPKFDKVTGTRMEELDIPQEWLELIEKPDGSWKKIIFYNTGITALLAHDEKWVNKIEEAFEIFKENQDEITLLWRPHPLIESTMQSMRPQILEKYLTLKETYLAEGWGIYDGSADMDRAVIMSDAYYGDASSISHLFRKVNKPVMLQLI